MRLARRGAARRGPCSRGSPALAAKGVPRRPRRAGSAPHGAPGPASERTPGRSPQGPGGGAALPGQPPAPRPRPPRAPGPRTRLPTVWLASCFMRLNCFFMAAAGRARPAGRGQWGCSSYIASPPGGGDSQPGPAPARHFQRRRPPGASCFRPARRAPPRKPAPRARPRKPCAARRRPGPRGPWVPSKARRRRAMGFSQVFVVSLSHSAMMKLLGLTFLIPLTKRWEGKGGGRCISCP